MYQARLDPNYQRHELGRSLVESVLGVGTFFVNAVRSALHREKSTGACLGFGPVVLCAHPKSTGQVDVIKMMEDHNRRFMELSFSLGSPKLVKKWAEKQQQEPVSIRPSGEVIGAKEMMESAKAVSIPMVTQLPFRPRKIVFDTNVKGIYVCDLKLGKNSIFLSCNPIPASTLHEQEFDWPPVNVGQQVTLTVMNLGDRDMVLGGMLKGEAAL